MKMSRTLLLAASLLVSPSAIIFGSETEQPKKDASVEIKVEEKKEEAKDKNTDTNTDADTAKKAGILATIAAFPALAKDKTLVITETIAGYSINLLTSRTLGKTRFAEYVTAVDNVVIGAAFVYGLYKLYNAVYNQEEENNDEIFNLEDLN